MVPGGARERRFVGLHLIFPQIPWVTSHGIASLGTIAGLVRRPIVHARPHRRVIRPPADRLRGRGPGRMYRNGDGQTATEPTPLDLNFFLSRFTEESPFWGQWLLVTARDVNGLVDRYGVAAVELAAARAMTTGTFTSPRCSSSTRTPMLRDMQRRCLRPTATSWTSRTMGGRSWR